MVDYYNFYNPPFNYEAKADSTKYRWLKRQLKKSDLPSKLFIQYGTIDGRKIKWAKIEHCNVEWEIGPKVHDLVYGKYSSSHHIYTANGKNCIRVAQFSNLDTASKMNKKLVTTPQDVHQFDTKLDLSLTIPTYSREEINKEYAILSKKLDNLRRDDNGTVIRPEYVDSSIQYLGKLVSDDNGNIDNVNKLNASDIITYISKTLTYVEEISEDTTTLETLAEQLFDLSTGECAQGRSIRLYQFARLLSESISDIMN